LRAAAAAAATAQTKNEEQQTCVVVGGVQSAFSNDAVQERSVCITDKTLHHKVF
jgi:hypothetical protein